MTHEATLAVERRIHFLDNLRTVIIVMVVLFHVGGVYESSGVWAPFWLVDDPATNDVVGIVNIILDLFMMPTMFLISGYLTPRSLRKKGARAFLTARFTRLMIPWFVAVLTLIPLYKVIFLYSRGLPQEHWTSYFHFSAGNLSSQNWLWFLPILFLFNVLYVLLSKANIKLPNISLTRAVVGATVISFAASLVVGGVFGFRAWTKTPLIDFENERLVLYFMLFLLGALCFDRQTFAKKPESKTLYTIANSVAWLPVTVHIFARLIPFMFPRGYAISPLVDWLIWWLSYYLSVVMLVYVLVESFRRYLDKPGKLWRELGQNSYNVYIVHVIVIGVLGTLLLSVELPSLVKYLILAVSSYVVSNAIVSLYRRARAGSRAASRTEMATSNR